MYARSAVFVVRLWLCLLALGSVQVAHAGFNNVQSSSGWNVNWDQRVIQPSPQWMPANSPSSGNSGWSIDSGLPAGKSTGHLPVGKGYIDVDARVLPDRPGIGAAFGRFARKVLPVISTAYAVKDLATELGYIFGDDGNVTKQDLTICTVAPCYEYRSYWTETWFRTRQMACNDALGRAWNSKTILSVSLQSNICYVYTSIGLAGQFTSNQRSIAAQPSNYVASSIDELANEIALKSGWPSNSKLPEVIKQMADAGEPIPASTPTVTGPMTVSGPTTTTTNPDQTTTVKTETYNVTYNNNTINYTTTIVTNNNGQITTETTGADPSPDQCAKHPDTVGCASLGPVESDVLNTSTHAVSVTPVVFAQVMACPAPLSFSVLSSSYSISYQPLCDRLALLRVLFLAMAGVLAAFVLADSFRVT